jgi:FtsP/CotA-like multicopper oxidase with cupredoxin domain
MDGAAEITQPAIEPGGHVPPTSSPPARPGSYFYPPTPRRADRQQALGLYGALIVDPPTRPSTPATATSTKRSSTPGMAAPRRIHLPPPAMDGRYTQLLHHQRQGLPDTETIHMRVGERLRVRFLGTHNTVVHPMHIHGGPFRIVQTDGETGPTAAQILKDTINVGPGERYDVIWQAREPGRWLLHCHIPPPHHQRQRRKNAVAAD